MTTNFRIVWFPAAEFHAFAVIAGPNRVRYSRPNVWFARDPGLSVCVDGAMYGSGGRLRFGLMDKANGIDQPGFRPRDGSTVNIVDGRAQWLSGARRATGATVAVQLFPELVRAGANVQTEERDTENQWRCAVTSKGDGALVGLAIGRGPMHSFANDLVTARCEYAGYTDGDVSAQLAFRNGQSIGFSRPRPVASFLGRVLPTPALGLGDFAMPLGLAGAGALAWWFLSGRDDD